MKKTITILILASLAFTSLQIACSKSEAQTTQPTTNPAQIGKLIFERNNIIWICNYDGTGLTQVNVILPSGIGFSEDAPKLSPNGQKIFFTAGTLASSNDYYGDLYTCNIDGSGVTKIVGRNGSYKIDLGGAY